MLKNKFSMLKVLALALSVLMLVSLAACGGKGVAEEDMNAAIQAALSEQAAADASKQAALESSLAAAQAAAESERKAVESSLAAAAAEASKAAAEASKAAAEAEKKASEEASKAAVEAAKAAASASKALEEATRTTTTKATETTAPIVKDDLTAVQIKFAEKKHEYLVTKASYYLASDYAELALLFDKAAIELQNALTVAAAENVLVTLDAEVADIKNAQTDAAAVQALIAALGDVETDVVTTVLDKKNEAEDALVQLIHDYNVYFEFNYSDSDKDINDIEITELTDAIIDKLEDLGVNVADLVKAEAKIAVLKNYVKAGLRDKIATLYYTLGYEDKFDEDGDELFVTVIDGDTTTIEKAACYQIIADGYYLYQVLSVVNGGDVAEADLPIDWEWLKDDEGANVKQPESLKYTHPITGEAYKKGDKVYDEEAPIDWFTAEQFMEIFATPYLNQELQYTIDAAVNALEAQLDPKEGDAAAYTAIYAKIKSALKTPNAEKPELTYIASEKDAELDEIFDEFEEAMDALTFVGDYKGNNTLADAQLDVWTQYIEAYIAAGNAIINASKVVAEEMTLEWYDNEVDLVNDKYEDKTSETALANLATKLENLATKKDAYLANIEAAPNYTYADLFDLDLIEDYEAQNGYDEDDADWDLADLLTVNGPKAELYAYINAVIADAMNKNFNTTTSSSSDQVGMLADLVEVMRDDLLALRDRLDPTNDDSDLYWSNKGRENVTLKATAELEGYRDDKYYANIPVFLDLIAQIDATIEAMEAVDEGTYEDKDVTLKVPEAESTYGSKNFKQPVYWLNETAKELALEEWDEQGKLESAVLDMLLTEANRLMGKHTPDDDSDNVTYDKIVKISMADYVTLTNTGIPVTYVYTATEQACMAARDLYNTMYTNMHAKLLELNGLVKAYKDEIQDDTYDDVVDSVASNAALKAEVEEFANLYVGYMDTYSALKFSFSSTFDVESMINPFSKSDYLKTSGNHITNKTGDLYDSTNHYYKNAKNYDDDKIEDDLAAYVALFDGTFYDANGKCNVITLWNYKTAVISQLNAIKSNYKNDYKVTQYLDTESGQFKEENKSVYAPAFGGYDAGKTASSTKGLAYEAQVDALFDSYIAKIEAVKLNSAVKVTNVNGDEMLKKWNKKTFDLNHNGTINAADGLTNVETQSDKVVFNIAAAKALVNAYAIDLVGKDVATAAVTAEVPGLGLTISGTPVQDLTGNSGYDLKNLLSGSRLEQAFDIYYNDTYGKTYN